jgi:hypothetical protein
VREARHEFQALDRIRAKARRWRSPHRERVMMMVMLITIIHERRKVEEFELFRFLSGTRHVLLLFVSVFSAAF